MTVAAPGAAVKDITQISRTYNWDTMKGYGRGIWAPCLTFNPGNHRFYVHFADPDFGIFMAWTDDITKNQWHDLQEVVRPDGTGFGAGWDDCGALWDDDGQGYMAANHFEANYKNYLYTLSQNGYQLQDEGVLIHETGDGLYKSYEGNPEALKILKKDGYYYIYHNGVVDGIRKAFLMRSEGIYGKHQDGVLGSRENPGDYEHIPYPIVEGYREPNQGNLIDILNEQGEKEWFFWMHQGKTDMDGRPNSLIPVIWNSDGWPVAGREDIRRAGDMVWRRIKKPLNSGKVIRPQTGDDFDGDALGFQWMWNCQPREGYWSLQERKGFLRLKAFRPVEYDRLEAAGNSLIQRMYRSERNVVTSKMDITPDGRRTVCRQLYLMGGRAAGIGICQDKGERYIRFKGNADVYGEKIPSEVRYLYFKAEWDKSMLVRSYYSFDGIAYIPFGEEYQIVESDYKGGHIGFFNYNNLSDAGLVDIDYFHYEMDVIGSRNLGSADPSSPVG